MNTANAKQDAQVPEKVLRVLKLKAENGKINCSAARALAKELQVPVSVVGAAANNLGIKINHCELGCF